MTEFEPRSYVISGEVPVEDWELGLQVLGRLGIGVKPLDDVVAALHVDVGEQPGSELEDGEVPYSLSEIVSRDQYLGDEHIEEFWQIHRQNLLKQGKKPNKTESVGSGLSAITYTQRRIRPYVSTVAERQQFAEELGLQIVSPRSKVGFPNRVFGGSRGRRYEYGEPVLQVGSFIDFMTRAVDMEPAARPRRLDAPTVRFFGVLATHLAHQIESADNTQNT